MQAFFKISFTVLLLIVAIFSEIKAQKTSDEQLLFLQGGDIYVMN